MQYKKNFICLLLGIVLFSGCEQSTKNTLVKGSPNIIWIVAEDLSPDLGCYGNARVQTPFLDSLTKIGTQFTNIFANAPACSPSRTALITGYYQTSIGAHHMRYPDSLMPKLPKGVLPIHLLLKEKGYQTANITSFPGNGKTDWLFDVDPNTFDRSKWNKIDNDTPFFAQVNLGLTHRKFEKDTINPIDIENIKVPPYYPDHPVAKVDWKGYLESIQSLDGQVAQIVADLEKNDLLENTVLFFFSDHGRPFTRAKNFLYDSGLKIPLIITSYDEKLNDKYGLENHTDDQLLSLIDITATTLDLAEIYSKNIQGHPFLGINKKKNNYVYGAIDRVGGIETKSRTVRDQRFRYIKNYYYKGLSVNSASTAYRRENHPIYHLLNILDEKGELNAHQRKLVSPMEPEELYDLKNDPYELLNLIDHPKWASKREEMRTELDRWIQEVDDKGMQEDSPEIIAAFEEYAKESQQNRKSNTESLYKEVAEKVAANTKRNPN